MTTPRPPLRGVRSPGGAREAGATRRSLVVPDKVEPAGQIRQANRERILGAAEKVFARAGFNGATMAAIAEGAELPKANLHYYFGSKHDLYREVLAGTLRDWLVPMDVMTAEAEPAEALASYIRAKMAMSAERPDASRVFANELLHGAPVLGDLMRSELRKHVERQAKVIRGWIAAGRMAEVDVEHLFFTIWAATQTYADFDVQVRAVLGRSKLTRRDHERATAHVVSLVLRGCGLSPATGVEPSR
jgi:TetR/AcrR family transcriptional regulator